MRIERCNVVVHRIIREEFVGVREEIALTFQETVRGLRVIGDTLPERVFAEIAGVGLFEKLLCGAQPGLFHLLCDGNGRCALREGQADALRFGIFRKRLDERIVGAAGFQRKFAVLELRRRVFAADVPAEQLREPDDARFLQLPGNGAHTAALRDLHGHGVLPGAAVDLALCQQECAARRRQHEHQQHEQDLQRTTFFAGSRMVTCHLHVPFSPTSAAYSSRSHQRVRPRSGSFHNPAGCPRQGRGSARHPR